MRWRYWPPSLRSLKAQAVVSEAMQVKEASIRQAERRAVVYTAAGANNVEHTACLRAAHGRVHQQTPLGLSSTGYSPFAPYVMTRYLISFRLVFRNEEGSEAKRTEPNRQDVCEDVGYGELDSRFFASSMAVS
jgi:hypothetical protein